jgi:molybdopterin molybdotransferase
MAMPLQFGVAMADRVLKFEEALAEVLRHARGLSVERRVESVKLEDSAGRALAEVVRAERDQPPFDRATRDGFAVIAADVGKALKVVGQVRAGESWSGAALGEGEAIEIMTGAPMPRGADAVVMVEHVSHVDGEVWAEAERTLRVGENVVPRGAEARVGDSLLPVGRVMGAAEVAVAASCGCAELRVFAKPKVAILATGDELVELAQTKLEESQIYNSNGYALATLVRGDGGFAGRLKIARDVREDLEERITQASMWDLMILSGGVSMGKYDLVEEVLAERGAEFFFTGAKIQPGKPVVFGRLPKNGSLPYDPKAASGGWTYFFGLPGNPVSTQVCFHLFVAPMLRAMGGRTEIEPEFVEAALEEDVKGGARVTRFLPAELTGRWDAVSVRVVGWQGSSDVTANARGNCYCVLPSGVEAFVKGDAVRVLLR